MRLRGRGFTLPELLVAMVISVILFGILSVMLVMMLRTTARSTVRVSMEQDSLFAMSQMVSDLQISNANGISFTPTNGTSPPVIIGIVPLNKVQNDGTQQWSTNVIVYTWNQVGGTLVRSVVTPSPDPLTGAQPLQFDAAALTSMSNAQQQTVLVQSVQAFSFSVQSATTGEPITISLTLSRQAATGARTPDTFQQTRTVSIRN